MSESSLKFPESGKIIYIVKMFPRLSETFIVNEILELEKQDFALHIYSLKKPADSKALYLIQSIHSPITYLPDSIKEELGTYIKYQWSFFIRHPAKYLGNLLYTINKLRLTALKRFFQAVCLAEQIQNENIAHIHAGFAHSPATVALLVHRLKNISYSFTAHAKDLYLSEPDSIQNKINYAKMVFTCTQYNKNHMDKLVSEEYRKKIYPVYHGIPISKFQKNGVSPQEKPRILSIGRLVEKKGHEYLIEACKILHDRGYRFRCDIVGGGILKEQLENKVISLGLQNTVELHGAKNQNELMEYYRHATIFVSPCIISRNGDRDGIPNVLMEAMTMEIPVIATNISGIPELIQNGVNGLLIPEKDSSQLADAISRLIEKPELRNELVHKGKMTIIEKFESAFHAQQLANLYREILSV